MRVIVHKTDDGFADVSTEESTFYRSANIPKKLIDELEAAREKYETISDTIFAKAAKDYRKQMIAEGIDPDAPRIYAGVSSG